MSLNRMVKKIAVFLLLLLLTVVENPANVMAGNGAGSGASITFLSGDLQINMAPQLDFGAVKISKKDMSYYVKAEYIEQMEGHDGIKWGNFIEVSDLRGERAGWTVNVAIDGQLKSQDGAVLEGAQIVFKGGEVHYNRYNWGDEEVYMNKDITLNPDEAQVVMKAEAGSGSGFWSGMFGSSEELTDINADGKTLVEEVNGKRIKMKFNPNITLEVPGESEKEETRYLTTLLWTINNTP